MWEQFTEESGRRKLPCIPRETLSTEKAGEKVFQRTKGAPGRCRQWLNPALRSRDVRTGVQQKLVCWPGMRGAGEEHSSPLHLSKEGQRCPVSHALTKVNTALTQKRQRLNF